MNRKSFALVFFLLLATWSLNGCMSVSFSGDFVVRAGTTLTGDLFVTSGTVTLEPGSQVTGNVVLTSGSLFIGRSASIGGNVIMTSGVVTMAEQSVVHGDIILSSSDITVRQAPGSRVEGRITNNFAPVVVSTLLKYLLLFCVLPCVLVVGFILLLGLWLGRISRRKPQPAAAGAPAGGAPAAPVSVPPASPAPVAPPAAQEDIPTRLRNLKSLLDEGLISQTDYEAKKADILSKM